MKISVLTPSYRMFLKDKQIEGLANQTFKDFEWVVVDGGYEQNKGFTAAFPVIHIPPSKIVNYFSLASPFNDGLSRCSGKYIFFMNDYVVPHKDCLKRHWEIQERFGGCLLSGRDFSTEGLESLRNDERWFYKDYRMALFDSGTFKSTKVDDKIIEIGRDGVQNWWVGHNDSAPLNAILECNGFDEAFDGAWGGQDAEMANRLMTYGLKYYLDKGSICFSYPHERGAKKERMRTEAEQQTLQETIINPKYKNGIYTANDFELHFLKRDLKGERDAKFGYGDNR